MFHVLTSTSEWSLHSDSMTIGRVYLRPDVAEAARFLKDGNLDLEEIKKYPALLMMEPQCRDAKPARVVILTSVKIVGKQVQIQYVNDPYVPAIPIDQALGMLSSCGLNEMSLNHSCWQVVDEELFKLLYTKAQGMRMAPTVFNFDAFEAQDQTLISVMMPFSAELKPVYETIQDAVGEMGLTCQRADDIWNHDQIIQDVVDLIARAKVVICDLTGRNSNVFYEAGIAHSLGKNVILITQSMDDVPFDLRHIRCLPYLKNGEGLQKLKTELIERISKI